MLTHLEYLLNIQVTIHLSSHSESISLSGEPRNLFYNKGQGDFYPQVIWGTMAVVDCASPGRFLATNFLVTRLHLL